MSSKQPLRLHVAMLNSVRAIQMLGGGKLLVSEFKGRFSKAVRAFNEPAKSQFIRSILTTLDRAVHFNWSAKAVKDAVTVNKILEDIAKDECPDIFLESIRIERGYIQHSSYTMEDETLWVPFDFHSHPFKPSTFKRLKGEMPSYRLYKKMQQIRRELKSELDKETQKRWRDILLLNKPHESLSNQDVINLWQNHQCVLLLKETRRGYEFMNLNELRG